MKADNTIENSDSSKTTIQITPPHYHIQKHKDSRFNQINYPHIEKTFSIRQLTKPVSQISVGLYLKFKTTQKNEYQKAVELYG